jgi:hypothetical protein
MASSPIISPWNNIQRTTFKEKYLFVCICMSYNLIFSSFAFVSFQDSIVN